jgi:beta-galactosidase
VAQLLANLGASFLVDGQVFHPLGRFNEGGFAGNGGLPMPPRPRPASTGSLGYYHPDYRTDFPMGDNPYRYYRW